MTSVYEANSTFKEGAETCAENCQFDDFCCKNVKDALQRHVHFQLALLFSNLNVSFNICLSNLKNFPVSMLSCLHFLAVTYFNLDYDYHPSANSESVVLNLLF